MNKNYEIKWWKDWLDADILKRTNMVEKLPFYKFCRDMHVLKDEKMMKHSFSTFLNGYFEDLESAVYTKFRIEKRHAVITKNNKHKST